MKKIFKTIIMCIIFLFSINLVSSDNNNCSDLSFCQVAGIPNYQMTPGDSKTFEWGLIWNGAGDENFYVEIVGNASQFVTYNKQITIASKQVHYEQLNIKIPNDTKAGFYYAEISAKMRPEGSGNVLLSKQMTKPIKITVLGEIQEQQITESSQNQNKAEIKSENSNENNDAFVMGASVVVIAILGVLIFVFV